MAMGAAHGLMVGQAIFFPSALCLHSVRPPKPLGLPRPTAADAKIECRDDSDRLVCCTTSYGQDVDLPERDHTVVPAQRSRFSNVALID
ncbi:unnamed protein product [Protopolystoma xenopodis]|uniref:Secreted protein n=1 Tax=Protopolystoma xenopodis TaxID=117903 RepID=A0A448WCZ0_9PLAT|nr:unnamed protein product [Protopolystoma xenopodis]